MSALPEWAQLIADFRERFGPGVRVTHVTLPTAPGWQLGMSLAEEVKRTGARLETYEHNMPGFGPPIESATETLPAGWKRLGDAR